jgi:hypothetical protein
LLKAIFVNPNSFFIFKCIFVSSKIPNQYLYQKLISNSVPVLFLKENTITVTIFSYGETDLAF